MIGWLRRWLFPFAAELQAIDRQRQELVTEARRNSLAVRWKARQLRRETTGQRVRMQNEGSAINELLSQMDERRND